MLVSIMSNNYAVVRVVKSEMGQGTISDLCQIITEELDCDWSKVYYEHPTPGESYKGSRPWGSF